MKRFAFSLLASSLTLLSAAVSQAATCYLLDDANHLLRFESNLPAVVVDTTVNVPAGTELLAMSIRTTTQSTGSANAGVGSIWAVGTTMSSGNDFRLFVIDPVTGNATQISALGNLGTSPGDDGWTLAFDPALDRFQFQGVELNYQINPNTGAIIAQTPFSGFPAYSGAAFTTASFGGVSKFYNVDCGGSPDALQTLANVSAGGTPTVIGDLTISVARPVGLAIDQSTFLFASNGQLYNINLTTGAATNPAAIMGNPTVRGLAILPTVFPPAPTPTPTPTPSPTPSPTPDPSKYPVTVKINGPKTVSTSKTTRVVTGTAASQAGITRVQYKIGRGSFKNAKGNPKLPKWKFTAQRLKKGVNKVVVQATGGNAKKSALAKLTIKVRK